MSINDATNVASAAALSATSSVKKVTKSLANNILAKTIHQLRRKCYKCYYAKSYDQLPIDDICDLSSDLIAFNSGPDDGISNVNLVSLRKPNLIQQQPPQQQQPSDQENTDVKTQQESSTTTNTNESQPTQQQQQQQQQQTKQPEINEKNLVHECWDSFQKSGITKWNAYHHRAYGIVCSLYENNPVTNTTVGDPIADVYAILTRKNSSIMILADGVNWGPRSRLAARCAVRASMNYINRNLFYNKKCLNTHDVFRIVCRSFDAAQEFILQRKGTMTTLCCSVVVKLKDGSSSSSNPSTWAVCTLSIGDSTAYVFNRSKGVFELTYGSRNLNNDRDMRNVGGALGHVYGNKPDVSNLNYSLMYIKENDIVFLVSDGVSDNLDPIVSQTARKLIAENDASINGQIKTGGKLNRSTSQSNKNLNKKSFFSSNSGGTSSSNTSSSSSSSGSTTPQSTKLPVSFDDQTINLSSLPEMSPYERYICSLAHMNEILLRNKTLNETLSAQETCAILIEHVMKLTAQKRDLLEIGLLEASKLTCNEEKLKFQASLREKSQKLRGKLDHASIVAYEVGLF